MEFRTCESDRGSMPQTNLSRPMSIALFGTKHNSAFGPTSMASRLQAFQVSIIRARGRTKGRKGKVLRRKEGRIMPILAKEKDQDQRHAPASTAMSEAISPSIVRRSRKEEKGSVTRDPKEKERERGRRKVRKERKVRRVQKVNPRGRGPQNFHNSRSLRLEVRFGLNLMLRKVAVCRCSHPHPKLWIRFSCANPPETMIHICG